MKLTINYICDIYIVKTLKRKVRSGSGEISSKLNKETISNIIHRLTHIIHRFLNAGIVPDQLKLAKVIHVFKASDADRSTQTFPTFYLRSLKY